MSAQEPSIPPKAQELFQKAEQAFQSRNYAYARLLYRSVLQESPDCHPARQKLHKAVMMAQPPRGGITACTAIARACFPMAVALLKEKKSDWFGALSSWEQCLMLAPYWLPAHRGYARCIEHLGWAEAAVDEYQLIRELAPDDARALWKLAGLYAAAQRRREAREMYEAILKIHPDDAKAPGELRRLSAMETLEKGAWQDAGGYRGKLRDEQDAQRLERGKRFEALQPRQEGPAADSLEEKRSQVEQYPTNLALRFELGEMYLEAGMLDEAIGQFQLSVKLPAKRVESQRHLAGCFRKKRLFDLALDQLRAAAEGMREMTDLKKEVLYMLAGVYEDMGRAEDALREYQKIYGADITYKDVAKKVERRT